MEQSATFKKKKNQTKIENEVLRFQRKKYFEICMYYKNQKAIKFGTKIITEDDFIAMCKE